MIRKIILTFFMVFILSGTNVFAEELGVDLYVGYSTETFDEMGGGLGFGLGAQYQLTKLSRKLKKLYGRFDINRYSYKEEFYEGIEATGSRLPIFLGARYLHPIKPITIFGELGLEISLDKIEHVISYTIPGTAGVPPFIPATPDTTYTDKGEDSKTHYGLSPGVGMLYSVTKKVYAGANVRFHIIEGSYLTIGIFAGYKFNI